MSMTLPSKNQLHKNQSVALREIVAEEHQHIAPETKKTNLFSREDGNKKNSLFNQKNSHQAMSNKKLQVCVLTATALMIFGSPAVLSLLIQTDNRLLYDYVAGAINRLSTAFLFVAITVYWDSGQENK